MQTKKDSIISADMKKAVLQPMCGAAKPLFMFFIK